MALVYPPNPWLPRASAGVGLLVTEFQANLMDIYMYKKFVPPETQVRFLTVDGGPAVWLTGAPHAFAYAGPNGDWQFEDLRLAGNTLLWQRGSLTMRLESALDSAHGLARRRVPAPRSSLAPGMFAALQATGAARSGTITPASDGRWRRIDGGRDMAEMISGATLQGRGWAPGALLGRAKKTAARLLAQGWAPEAVLDALDAVRMQPLSHEADPLLGDLAAAVLAAMERDKAAAARSLLCPAGHADRLPNLGPRGHR